MKAVICFIFKDGEDNFIEDNQKLFNYDHKFFVITDKQNLPKSLYSKVEHIFYFKDKKICFKSVHQIIDYLEMFNYKQAILINMNKKYNNDQLIFNNLSEIKEQLAVVNNVL